MYEILVVPETAPELFEQLGTKRKFWFHDEQGNKCLFKEGRPGTGENWAEKVASELCLLLQLPHASYELATWRNTSGVITPTIVLENGRLVLGNELLPHFVSGYEKEKKYKQKQHTLKRVLILVGARVVRAPIGFHITDTINRALDVFIGYLMFDAWIANQDRHHENWGMIVTSDGEIYLAPTFDHASGFGRNETDANRKDRLMTRDMRRNMVSYVERAITPFYMTPSSGKPMTTMEVFQQAASLSPRAGHAWLDRLAGLDENKIASIFNNLPTNYTSQVSLEFAQKMMELNRVRLLSLRGALS